MLFLAYQVFLADSLLTAEGYAVYGYFGAAVILISVIVSAMGQHSRVARSGSSRAV